MVGRGRCDVPLCAAHSRLTAVVDMAAICGFWDASLIEASISPVPSRHQKPASNLAWNDGNLAVSQVMPFTAPISDFGGEKKCFIAASFFLTSQLLQPPEEFAQARDDMFGPRKAATSLCILMMAKIKGARWHGSVMKK